jgi:glyoxylate reductase
MDNVRTGNFFVFPERRVMKPKVYISSIVPPFARELLQDCCDLAFYQGDAAVTADEILSHVGDMDGLLCLVADRIGKEVIEAGRNLKVISTASVGFEHIDVAEATRRGIYVGYAPGVLTDATADLAFALLLSAARRIAEADRFVRAGSWKVAWSPTSFLGASVYGRTLGLIGLGRIGKAMAGRARGFGMNVLYTDERRLSPDEERELKVEFRTLNDLLAESDFVSLHVPSTKGTYHLMNEERLKLMKPGAVLVNTARGPVVDEQALYRALKEGALGAAGLDVFEKEPIDEENPLLGLANVTFLPHIGSATVESRRRMAEVAAMNILHVFKGEPPEHWLNPEVVEVRRLDEVKMV